MELTAKIPHELKTIYIGGGTPSCLSSEGLSKLINGLKLNYKVCHNAEFSMELNPGTIDNTKLSVIKDLGVNRISIGVQSFRDNELRTLGRIHNSKEALDAVNFALNKEFLNVSIDLIYGIPFQRVEDWIENLKIALSFEIKHISIYELTIEEKTKLYEEIMQGKLKMPDENEIVEMYISATEFLEANGLKKYEISNFAKKGFECQHNLSYWNRKSYLGIGPSAHSFIADKRFHNPADLFSYSKALLDNQLAWIDDYVVNRAETLKERVFLGLRKRQGIIVKRKCLLKIFKDFQNEQLVKIIGNNVRLTDKGMLISNEIFERVLLHIENCPVCKQG
ncbi:radical SAM family heme chaperone HemW [Thermodesulfovibrio hydrogeniphilus]